MAANRIEIKKERKENIAAGQEEMKSGHDRLAWKIQSDQKQMK